MRAASLLDASHDRMAYLSNTPNPLARPAESLDAPDASTTVASLDRVKYQAASESGAGAETTGMALLVAFVRARLTGWIMAVISIGSVLLAWHLATHYRLDFYVRFGNIPSPGDVFEKVIEVNQSTTFVTNIGMDGLNNAVIPGHATPEQYTKEITVANDGIVDQKGVYAYASNSFAMIEELDKWGIKFEKDETGDYAVRKVHHIGSYVLPMPEGHHMKRVLYRQLKKARVEITNRVVAKLALTSIQMNGNPGGAS